MSRTRPAEEPGRVTVVDVNRSGVGCDRIIKARGAARADVARRRPYVNWHPPRRESRRELQTTFGLVLCNTRF